MHPSAAKADNIGFEIGTAEAVPFQNIPNAIALFHPPDRRTCFPSRSIL
jgi:hypothetical protein